ncbi:MAG: ribulose-phosphate 3-epimerase [Lachnospiraceae bacterium]|nr:ribulose-phosphate 3-epimerase [Lachnospiraceae bacterium]
MYHLSPSMLCANPLEIGAAITEWNQLKIDWFHIDVMDGKFVPNFAMGTDCFREMCKAGKHPFYVHMMAENPEKYIPLYAEMGASYYCFHYETTNNPFRICQAILENGMKPAIALNPITPVEAIKDLLPYLDVVTLMAIEPGFSGQEFLQHTYNKISCLKEMIRDFPVLIEVDGGADDSIAARCIRCGCDVVVGGYFSVFRSNNTLKENYETFMTTVKEI